MYSYTGGLTVKPPPLARKMPSRLFKYRWAGLPCLERGRPVKKMIHSLTVSCMQPNANVCDFQQFLGRLDRQLTPWSNFSRTPRSSLLKQICIPLTRSCLFGSRGSNLIFLFALVYVPVCLSIWHSRHVYCQPWLKDHLTRFSVVIHSNIKQAASELKSVSFFRLNKINKRVWSGFFQSFAGSTTNFAENNFCACTRPFTRFNRRQKKAEVCFKSALALETN